MNTPIFRHFHRVTYAECTLGNHVYYGRYLDLLESARGEFFRQLGKTFLAWQREDTIFPVIECRLRYRGAARYDDRIAIEVWPMEIERVRLTFAYHIVTEAGAEILQGSTLHACTSVAEKPKRLPEELAAALRAYLRSA